MGIIYSLFNPKNQSTVTTQINADILDVHTIAQSLDTNDLEHTCDNSRTIVGQTRDNSETIVGQTRDNPETIVGQTRDNPETIVGQTRDSSETIMRQTRDSSETNCETNLVQYKYCSNFPYMKSFINLCGLQQKLVRYIFDLSKHERHHQTPPIPIKRLAKNWDIPLSSIRKSLQRLQNKRMLIKIKSQSGPDGWVMYALVENVFQEILQIDTHTSNATNFDQNKNNSETNCETTLPSSSSYIINKTTTALPEDWQKINLIPLEDIGFTQKHLADIYKTKLATPSMVQQSIDHFAYGLECNPKKYQAYTDPLNVLIGCLRKGNPWFESNYVSTQERALKALAEQQAAENERIKELEQQLLLLKFQDWQHNLTEEEKQKYLVKHNGKVIGPPEAHLRHYFTENVWPRIRADYWEKINHATNV